MNPNLQFTEDSLTFRAREKKIIGGFLDKKDSGDFVARHGEILPGKLLQTWQVHGIDTAYLFDTGCLNDFESRPREEKLYDGLVTDRPGKILIIRTADCVPILFYSLADRDLVGALHCGWRSMAGGIISGVLKHLDGMGYDPSCFRFWIGPAIGQECYEVGEELIKTFESMASDFSSVVKKKSDNPNKYLLDMKGLARLLLLVAGVDESNLDVSPICTRCHPAFNSHRENQTKERNINFISILSPD